MSETPILDAALAYARRGWPVLPVRRDSDPKRDKQPLVPHGKDDATTDLDTIRAWWERWPDANVAIRCGPEFGAVLDIDADKGGLRSLREAEAEHGALPTTAYTLTGGGGQHRVFRHPGRRVKSLRHPNGPGPRLDTRGDGGYIVAPPSVHGVTGREYKWARDYERGLADWPDWLDGYSSNGSSPMPEEGTGGPIENRHRHLLRLIGWYRNDGRTITEALAAAIAANKSADFAEGPKPEQEVIRLVKDVYGRYEAGQAPSDGDEAHDVGDPRPYNGPQPKLDAHGMGDLFVAQYGDRFRFDRDAEGWLYCIDGRWHEHGARLMAEQAAARTLRDLKKAAEQADDSVYGKALKQFARGVGYTGMRNGALDYARSHPAILIAHDALDQRRDLLACANGTLDLRTGKLRPHDPRDLLTRGSPIAYVPDAAAPRWSRFLREVFIDEEGEPDEEMIAYMQRVVGYCLTGEVREEQFWIFYGRGGNGKGKFVDPLYAILGRDLYKPTPMAVFAESQHERHPTSLARLDRARLVVADEKKRKKALDESVVQMVTGGVPITARFMRQDEFTYDPQFKLFLIVNDRPPVHADHAMRRRTRMVPFRARFDERADEEENVKAADRNLADELHAEVEGIFAWAVRGAVAYYADGLGTSRAVVETSAEYMREMNPLRGFADECCKLAPGLEAAAKSLRDEYDGWCAADPHERPRLSNEEYGNALELLGARRTRTNKGIVWRGIAIKSVEERL